jgi:hypothetical protein
MELYRRSHEPTPGQIKAGNYFKRAIRWRGLVLRIENEAGTYRSGRKPDGTLWTTRMIHPYGYACRSEGVDGDEVDVFVGPNLAAPMVYVVHQRQVGNWSEYDEDKCLIGFDSEDDAKRAFLLNYDDPRFLGPITALPADTFVAKVRATYRAPAMIKSMILLFGKNTAK